MRHIATVVVEGALGSEWLRRSGVRIVEEGVIQVEYVWEDDVDDH